MEKPTSSRVFEVQKLNQVKWSKGDAIVFVPIIKMKNTFSKNKRGTTKEF
jgi:hypothetical protein